MTDLLADRLNSLVNRDETGDWLDVRRRARRQAGRVVLYVATAAAVLAVAAVAAVAATNGWVFASGSNQTTNGAAVVQLHGHPYSLFIVAQGRWAGFLLTRGRSPHPAQPIPDSTMQVVASASGGSLLRGAAAPIGPAFGAVNYDQGGGQIWFGDARPQITRIEITDTNGQVFRTQTTAAPGRFKLAFRFWAIALPSSTGTTIAGYDKRGHLVDRRPIPALKTGLRSAMYLH